ncbi:MAG TPA: MDR family MFS transporter [Candidatus Limnocylindria bacterium]|nr:MDR family MFS transporter [Candidatus Limnocylindria bacterium]
MAQSDTPITREQLLISAGVMAGIAVAALDSTVVGTAMPTIIGQLGGIEQYGWVFAAYLLTATTTVPIFSTLADIHGRKPIFLAGLALFVGGSALCGLSGSMLELIVFRAIQGLGAGAVQPIAFTIVGDIFEPRQRAKMQGLFSSVWGVSAIIGPALGGLITETIGWRWVFYINVPVGLLAAILTGLVLQEHVVRREHRLDWAGMLTLTGGVTLLLLFASELGNLGWSSPIVIGSLIASLVLLVAFARGETRVAEPLISLELLRRPIVGAGLAIGVLAGVVMFGLTAYVPPLIQGVMRGSPIDAGLAVGAMSIGWPIGSIIAGRAILRVGVRPVVLAGTFLLMVGTALLTQADRTGSVWYTAFATIVTGLGMGLTTTPTLVAIQTAVSWQQRAQATGLVQFSRTIGGAVGTGLLGALLAASVGPGASQILDPILRTTIPAARLASESAGLGVGLGWIYLILVGAGVGTWLLALRLMPAVRIGEGSETDGAAPVEAVPARAERAGRAAEPRRGEAAASRPMGEP